MYLPFWLVGERPVIGENESEEESLVIRRSERRSFRAGFSIPVASHKTTQNEKGEKKISVFISQLRSIHCACPLSKQRGINSLPNCDAHASSVTFQHVLPLRKHPTPLPPSSKMSQGRICLHCLDVSRHHPCSHPEPST